MLQGIIAGPAASASGSLGTKGALLGKGFLAAQSATRQATAQFPQRSSQSRLALQAAVASEVDARNFTPNSRRPQAAPEHLQVGAVMQNLACAAHVPGALPVAVHVIWRELEAGSGSVWWGWFGAFETAVASTLAPPWPCVPGLLAPVRLNRGAQPNWPVRRHTHQARHFPPAPASAPEGAFSST